MFICVFYVIDHLEQIFFYLLAWVWAARLVAERESLEELAHISFLPDLISLLTPSCVIRVIH